MSGQNGMNVERSVRYAKTRTENHKQWVEGDSEGGHTTYQWYITMDEPSEILETNIENKINPKMRLGPQIPGCCWVSP
jgi:hypothetical protein